MTFKDLTENVICKFKAATAWRSADLAGIYIKNSFLFREVGQKCIMQVRNYNTKTRKGRWSNWIEIEKLEERFANVCLVRAVQLLIAKVETLSPPTVTVKDPSTSREVQDTPLFVAASTPLSPLKDGTIRNKFKSYFMENISVGDEKTLASEFSAHSSRNAVASAAADMGIPTSRIAALALCSIDNLQSTYITTVQREYEFPPAACLNSQQNVSTKLLLPWVHYTTSKDGGACLCSSISDTN